jgi:ribose/xylose/arabinose/galactoside ABC-type transport system permease subunit
MKIKTDVLQKEYFQKLAWQLAALGGIILFNIIFTHGFFGIEIKDGHLFGSMIDILNRGAPVMLLSIGMTLVFAAGGIDLSVGSVIAMSGALAAQIIRPGYVDGILEYPNPPAPLFLIILLPLLISMAAGLWNGFLVTFIGIKPIIETLIFMVAGRGIAQLITKGQITIFIHESFQFIGSGFLFGIHFPIILVIVLLIITYLLTRKTSLGLFIESVGANPTASRYLGIRTKLIVLSTYVFCALCSGLAGLIVCADIKGAYANNAGLWFELDAIASVVIGGTLLTGGAGFVEGTLIGVLILGLIQTLLNFCGKLNPWWYRIFIGILLFIFILLQTYLSKTAKLRRRRTS